MKRLSLLLALCLAPAVPAAAQVHGGGINGTVSDQRGGVLAGATVTAQGIDATQATTTTSDGAFHFLDLAPGSYKITTASDGFQSVVRDGVIVEVGKTIDLPVVLPVASISEVVTVGAAAPMVNATPAGTATNFTNSELTNIPTSRDPFALIRAVPGALTERVNVGGNETGQQLITVAKAARPQDTSWTLDGVEITDMASPGQSATYFNFDNFDEIHVSTAGNDIRERTGALTIDLSVKRGGNQFHGSGHGYFTDNSLQSTNIPAELLALPTPVTQATSDHVTRGSDYGFDLGGPVVRDRAWFYMSYSSQNEQLFRRSTNAIDRTTLDDPNVKINVQATKKDLVNFLWYNGYKIKDNRPPGAIAIEQAGATWHQDNVYASSPLHGLWKIADDRVFNPHLFASAKYAYFNTGISLTPEGGMNQQAGQNVVTQTDYGSTLRQLSTRPQHTATLDLNSFANAFGVSHNIKFGGGYRTVDAFQEQEYPGNGILAITQTLSDLRAKVYREGNGGNRTDYVDFYVGDTITRSRLTIDLGARYDRQWGFADPSTSQGNPAFPTLVPGIVFAGYRTPFTWNNISPRAGALVALDESGKTVARVMYTSFAGQLATSTVGAANLTSGNGSITYHWNDLNGDGFVQPNEVDTTNPPITSSGINPANPSSVTSPNQFDPNLKAPTTRSVVAGIEREVMPNLAVHATYTYSRTSDLFGNAAANITPRVGVTLANYTPGPVLTGVLPNGAPYSVATSVINPALFAASGGGFYYTNVPGYYTDYNGVEVGLVKRMSKRWMARASFAYNNARDHFSSPAGLYDNDGNPTRTVTEPLVNGGQFAPQENGGSGNYYLNAKWQVNMDGMYHGPYGIDLAANVFGRQGYPYPIVSSTAVGPETLAVLLSPQIDTFRYPNVWDTDARIARSFVYGASRIQLMVDVFNLFNADTALVRLNNISPGVPFNQALKQNMTPRIVRLGVNIGF